MLAWLVDVTDQAFVRKGGNVKLGVLEARCRSISARVVAGSRISCGRQSGHDGQRGRGEHGYEETTHINSSKGMPLR